MACGRIVGARREDAADAGPAGDTPWDSKLLAAKRDKPKGMKTHKNSLTETNANQGKAPVVTAPKED